MNWLAIFNPLVDAFNGWRGRKHELKLAKHQLDVVQVESKVRIAVAEAEAAIGLAGQRQTADINWEILSIKNSGWKDEYLTILTTLVLVLVFLPWTQPYIMDGFVSLDATPVWFQVIVLVVYSSAFGVRAFDAFTNLIRRKKVTS